MVKGGILFLSVFLLSYGFVTTLEYLGRFGSNARLLMLISFVGINAFLLVRFLLLPLLKINKVGKHLTLRQASNMIGAIFPDIGDKLSNTLQLNESKQDSSLNLELVRASIEQRSSQLSVIPFSSAIDFKENRKYLRFLIPIFLTVAIIGISNPDIFKDGTERVVNFDTEYVEPAPFEFVLSSDSELKEGDDYTLQVKLIGDEIPNEVKIYSNLGNYNLVKKGKNLFEYKFNNLSESLNFYCEANDFRSDNFSIKVLKKPVVEEISLKALYPKHTGRQPEEFQNSGDISVPEGTLIKWNVIAKNMEELEVLFKDTSYVINTSLSNGYTFKRKFLNSESYTLILSSSEVKNADSLFYNVTVIKDKYPTIAVDEQVDSTNELRRFIEGQISDDYGFRSLSANMKVIGEDTSYTVRKSLKVNGRATNQLFSYQIDMSLFNLGPGDRVEYSFTITDNDEINGFKSSTSSRRVYKVPEMDELENLLSDQSDELKEDIDDAMKTSFELKKKIKDMKSTLMNKDTPDWKDRQSMENLMDMQRDLQEKIENMKKDYEKNKNDQENFMELDEEYKEKMEKLQELMDELMDEELLELFKELQKLMDEMNKNDLIENLEKMEMETESMEEKMDRTLELFKNMELDEKLENLEEQLRDLKKQQDELQEMTENKEKSSEELSEMQEDINEKFDEIQKDIEEVKEKNDELEKPRDLDFDKEKEEELDSELNEAKENLDKGKESKSSENQEKSSEMMEEMADDIAAMQSQSQQQQQQEDMEALRYLLENIVTLSHLQEALMNEYSRTQTSDPYYLELNRNQLDIDKATDVVRDSLTALSKRVHQLSTFITDELNELNYNLDKSLVYSEERSTSKLMQHQQYAMTDYNDLALMLSEVLDQMQQAMMQSSGKPGSGSCNKPGGSGQGKGDKGKMSMEQMKKSIQDQIDKMNKGKNPGGTKGEGSQGEGLGEKPGGIKGLSVEDQVKMAAEQGRIREELKKMREELNKDGSGFGNTLNDIIEDIDQLEEDLLNGNVGQEYLKRQEDILTRLLEHEKAMRERGFSEERESNEGKNIEEGNQIEFTEYNRKKKAEVEFMRSLPLGLQVYYKTLVNEYFNSVNN